MIDNHYHPENWGMRPILFSFGNFEVQSYPFFVLLGLIVGILVYFYEVRKKGELNEKGFMVAVGSLVGGVIGAKILEWIVNYKYIFSYFSEPILLLSGRTITGGLIGGIIGALIVKKILKINERRGNLFAPAVAIGVGVGRVGCFLRGCCYGKETSLSWGVNFGDGISRHPTQLYEAIFMIGMFLYLERIKKSSNIKPGQLLDILFVSYFVFRFFIEFIRTENVVLWGLTSFQIISIGAIIYLTRSYVIKLIFNSKFYGRSN